MFSSGHKLLPLGDFRPLCQNLKQCVFLSTKEKVEKTSENAFDLQTLINEIFRYFIEMDFLTLIFDNFFIIIKNNNIKDNKFTNNI